MLLYDSQVSGNCYKVRLLLTQLGLPFERHELDVVDRSNRAAVIGERNPALRVPTLILDDGRALPESGAILWYFADGTQYLPDDRFERAQALQWMFFEQYDVEPNIAVARFWKLFGIERSPAEVADKVTGGQKALAALERYLAEREYLVGSRYTIADIALYGYTHVAEEGGFSLEGYPAVRAWHDRVAAQPGHIPITA
jgi:glutathione S-transferase